MSNRKRMRWLLAALALLVVAGFVAYDFRDRLPSSYTLEAKTAEACASLPKPGREGRYQNFPACPWNDRVGPKQEFSGILQPNEHGAWFLVDDYEPRKGSDAWPEWRVFGPSWGVWVDEKASRSLQRLKANHALDPDSPAHRVKLRGWRTVKAGNYGYAYYVKKPHVLFVDEFTSVEPEYPED
jgi:hypothetical protein